jgi:Zn-dependent protease
VRGVFSGSAWRICRVAGIDIAVDYSWLLIFLLITFSLGTRFAQTQSDWPGAERWGAAVLASLLFFSSIVLHELGHSLVALRLGVRVRSITLFIFGGLASLESEPKRPRDEVLIATAGPLVSVALGLAFLAAARALPDTSGPLRVLPVAFSWLGTINLVLAAFNAVPGFPLDGGRILRGILWSLTGSFERATRMAAASGTLFAYALMIFGVVAALLGGQLVGGLWLVFIGWFLMSAARATVGQVVVERILERVRAGDAMEPVGDACFSGRETIEEVVTAAVLTRGLRTLYVTDAEGTLSGLVTLRELTSVPAEERRARQLREVMRPAAQLVLLDPADTCWTALREMAERGVNQLPVVERGRLLGVITREQLLRLVQASLALESGAGSRGGLRLDA